MIAMNGKWIACLTGAVAVSAAAAYVLAPGKLPKEKKQLFTGVNYAHRGLHAQDKSVPENSLEGFRLAALAGYGAELDVQLSKDGQVVVFHDDTLDRVCGVSGRVDERSYAELQELRLCGTEHRIPLFSEVLAAYDGAGPLIVELKTGRRNDELCEKTLALLKDYKGVYCIESFDPFIVAWFRRHAPEVVRGQLAMAAARYGKGLKKRVRGFLLSRTMFNFLTRPQFIAYDIRPKKPLAVRLCEWMGAMKIGWTAREPGHEKDLDSVIFEFYQPKPRY